MQLKNNLLLLLYSLRLGMFGQFFSKQMVLNIERGINAGNVLSAPSEGNWATVYTVVYLNLNVNIQFQRVSHF